MEKLRLWAVMQRSALYKFVFATVAIGLAVGSRIILDPVLPVGFPFLTIFPAVILTAYFAGAQAGAAVSVICGLAAWYLFVAPVYSFALNGPSIMAMLFYALIVVTDLLLVHAMRVALTRLEAEKQHSDALAQANKTMFHELQHRVSNNLQVVASLLKMQRRNVNDEAAKAALDAASTRVQAVASIQRRLHNPKRQTADLAQLMRDLLPEVVSNSALSKQIELQFDTQPILVNGDQATPLALILVELVSNAVEHAVRDGAVVHLKISMRTQGDEASVIVQDDGPGLSPDFVPERSRSLGLRVAFQFSEQLGGRLRFISDGGTRVTLTFPLDRPPG